MCLDCSTVRRGELGGYGDILGVIDIVLGGVALQAVALDIRFGIGVAEGMREEEGWQRMVNEQEKETAEEATTEERMMRR